MIQILLPAWQVAGIQGGVGAIPDRWLQQLRGREIVQELLALLL